MSTRTLLLPVAMILFGLAACTSTPPLTPPSTRPILTVPASAAPSPAAPSPVAPSPVAPSTVAPTPAAPRASTPAPAAPQVRPARDHRACPSAKALERLYDLPDGFSFEPSSVDCWKNWAWAVAEGPREGDGMHLFRYTSGDGWRYHSQGSAYTCAGLGIRERAPFCH